MFEQRIAQRIETASDEAVVRSIGAFVVGDRTPIEPFRGVETSLLSVDLSQVIDDGAHTGVVGAEGGLLYFKTALVQGRGLGIAPLAKIDSGDVVEHIGVDTVARPQCVADNLQRSGVNRFRFAIQATGEVHARQTAKGHADQIVVGRIDALLQCDSLAIGIFSQIDLPLRKQIAAPGAERVGVFGIIAAVVGLKDRQRSLQHFGGFVVAVEGAKKLSVVDQANGNSRVVRAKSGFLGREC